MDKVGGGCSGASDPPCRGSQILRRLTTSWQWAPTAAPAPCGPSGDPESSAGFSWSSCLMVVLSTVLSQGERKQSISGGLFKSCVSSCRGGVGDTVEWPLCCYTQRRGSVALVPGSRHCGRGGLPAVSGLMATSFSWAPFALAPGGKCQEMGWKFASTAQLCAVNPGHRGSRFCVPRLHPPLGERMIWKSPQCVCTSTEQ